MTQALEACLVQLPRKIVGICLVLAMALQFGCSTLKADEETQFIKTRLEPIPVENMNPAQKSLLGIVDGEPLPKRATMKLFRTLAHHPELMSLYFPMGDAVNRAPQIPDKPRELFVMRIAWLYQAEYEWAQHYGPAIKAGWSHQEVERIKLGSSAPGWTTMDRALLDAADQLISKAYINDETWAALRKDYSEQDIMVLMTVATHYHWVAMMTKTLGIELEDGKQGFSR